MFRGRYVTFLCNLIHWKSCQSPLKRELNKILNEKTNHRWPAHPWYSFHFTNYRPQRVGPFQLIFYEFEQHIWIDNENIIRGIMHRSLDERYFYKFTRYSIRIQLYFDQYNSFNPHREVRVFRCIISIVGS